MDRNIPRTDDDDDARALGDRLGAISRGQDEVTKVARAAEILAKTPPEIAAIVTLALLARVRHLEARLAVYQGLVAKLVDVA